jgi:uncharacterized protein
MLGRVLPPKPMRLATVAAAILSSLLPQAFAASFDCTPYARNHTCPQSAICAHPELSSLDERLAGAYQDLLSQSSGISAVQLKSEKKTWLASRNACGCNTDCLGREYRRRSDAMGRVNAQGQRFLLLEAIGVWGLSRDGCDLFKSGQLEEGLSDGQASKYGIIEITSSAIQWMHGSPASCSIATTAISKSRVSISFPVHCQSHGQEMGQYVIVNMHGNDEMRLSFLGETPLFKAENYTRCTP